MNKNESSAEIKITLMNSIEGPAGRASSKLLKSINSVLKDPLPRIKRLVQLSFLREEAEGGEG